MPTLNQLLIIGAIVGLVVGLVPLIAGFKGGNRKIGIIGFVVTLVSGVFLSLLGALPAAGLFTWLALRKSAVVENASDEFSNDDPAN